MDKIEEQLARIVEKAIEVAEKTGEFVIDQAPMLLQEFYRWHTIQDVFLIILGLSGVISFQFIPRAFSKKHEGEDVRFYDDVFMGRVYKNSTVVGAVAIKIIGLLFLLPFFIGLWDLMFILTAPKLYLIEYFLK